MQLKLVKGRKGRRLLAVEIPVTRRHLAQGINATRVGRYLFRGAWYGRDLADIDTYGKIEGQKGQPIGKLSGRPTPYLLRKLGAQTIRIWESPTILDRSRKSRQGA